MLQETCQEFYDTKPDLIFSESQSQEAKVHDINDFDYRFDATDIPVPSSPGYDQSSSLAQEILNYLSEPVHKGSPLDWWRNNASQFPRLAAMARDFLCIPGEPSQPAYTII